MRNVVRSLAVSVILAVPVFGADVREATIADLRAALEARRVTSRELVRQSLARIALYEDRLNATLAVNPKALDEAAARDRERAQ
jgi:amidase